MVGQMMSKEFTTNAFPQTTFSPQQVMEREALVNFFFINKLFQVVPSPRLRRAIPRIDAR